MIYQSQKRNNMLTEKEIVSQYMDKQYYRLNACVNFYMDMHNNGHHARVLSFLLKGDYIIGKQGHTYDTVRRNLCTITTAEFNDQYGAYAGTHWIAFYEGQQVDAGTHWALM